MSDQIDAAGTTALQSADRLEQALERIAAHAQDGGQDGTPFCMLGVLFPILLAAAARAGAPACHPAPRWGPVQEWACCTSLQACYLHHTDDAALKPSMGQSERMMTSQKCVNVPACATLSLLW